MKVYYTKALVKNDCHSPGEPAHLPRYVKPRYDFCCVGMKELVGSSICQFSDAYGWDEYFNLVEVSSGYDGVEHDYHEIYFCPMCGERIELVQEKVVREITEQVERTVVQIECKTRYEEICEKP